MKKLLSGNFLLILACFIVGSCNENDKLDIERSAAAFDIKQGEASIKQSNRLFMKSFENSDSTEVSNCYTTHAKIMAAGAPTIEGRDDIKHFISEEMNEGIKSFELKTIKIWGDSSLLAEEGTYLLSDGDDKQLDKGKYIVLWKLETGNWKMFRDIRTSDLPLVEATTKPRTVHKKKLIK
ncbi:MAG: hypothetical protein ABIR03_04405 [Ginsengibacter sp.]